LVIVHSYQQRGELKHLTPIGQAGFPIARRAAADNREHRHRVRLPCKPIETAKV
jgi:hypothetical protein